MVSLASMPLITLATPEVATDFRIERDDVVRALEVLVVRQGHEVARHHVAVTQEQLDHLHLAVLERGHAERAGLVEGLEAGEGEAVDPLQPGLATGKGRALRGDRQG